MANLDPFHRERPGAVRRIFAAAAVAFAIASPLVAPNLAYADYSGSLKSVEAATVDSGKDYVVNVTFNDGVQGKITFLEDGIFRYNVDPSGEFSEYATPRSKDHTAKIPAQPDTSSSYAHPKATVKDAGDAFEITSGDTTVVLDKATAKLSVKVGEKTVMREKQALSLTDNATTQTVEKESGESFFGGGTQNGRFIHTGQSIDIVNNNTYVDGGVSSPNPFYWTSDGYGVLRNTFSQGSYDFGKTAGDEVVAEHQEDEFDAYYFVTDASGYGSVAQDLLQDYFKVTGNPVLLPAYAFYLGHYNAYNRDMWSDTAQSGYRAWRIWGHSAAGSATPDTTRYEKGGTGTKMEAGSTVETLNGDKPTVSTQNIPEGVKTDEKYSARAVVDEYLDYDMSLGYFLPNDGYGAGYGQNGYDVTGGVNADGSSSAERLAAVAANVDNLKRFRDYAKEKGVETGLWTQSNLSPDSNASTPWHTLRDFSAEVKTGGVTTLKTDVAWVGSGYSFGLNGTKTAYDIVTTRDGDSGIRPNIVTLDGWAGSQRFAGVWTGDQTGGNWEYIRFHVPTFIGQSLSGNPNIGSDMDGIWGGNPIVATRDYQWKSFAPLMLDMDGWGSYAKMPYSYGDPYTGINRMYLKLKSSLMPYIYTTAASAANIDTGNGDAGLPIVRAILLSDNSAYAASTATQYEYTLGENILVAPIYQNTDGDAANGGLGDGNDVRNNIYLPGTEDDVWVDYWTGKQYRGGQVLNNFDAPIWKLPVFVKANAIIPMYKPNDNPNKTDRTKRDVEFFATAGEGSYTQYEDTGTYIQNKTDTSDEAYGTEDNISYGSHVSTTYTSQVDGDTATFTAKKSEGSYTGYKPERTTTFVVNASAEPQSLVAKNGDAQLKLTKVNSQEALEAAEPKAGEAVYFYNETPNLNYNATSDSEAVRNEEFSKTKITTTPKLYVKFAKTDVSKSAQTLTVKGFENDGHLPTIGLDKNLAVPTGLAAAEETKTSTSIKLTWNKVEGATGYELKVDGTVFSVGDVSEYNHTDLSYNSTHVYQVRSRGENGYSEWSDVLTSTSLKDPWRNAPEPETITWTKGDSWGAVKNAFDHKVDDKMFHSTNGDAVGEPMTIDYGKAYQLDKFVYVPRQDNGGNGNVGKMKLETSMDGVHWQEHETDTWDNSGADKLAAKTVNLTGTTARYLRLTVKKSTGGFFSAAEMTLYKVDGTTGSQIGAINGSATVTDAAYQHLKGNCLGRENREPMVDQFNTHVAKHGADYNLNGAFDAYDMSFTMSALDGGTKKTGKVDGNVAVVPSATDAKAGDVISVDVLADDVKNANALGALVHYDSSKFEFVAGSITQDGSISQMENLSVAQGGFTDGIQSVNLAFLNRGDQKLYSGSGVVASFKLRAKADTSTASIAAQAKASSTSITSTAWVIGPKEDFKETVNDGTVTFPEVPSDTKAEYGQEAFDITMTNDELVSDDGTNVSKLIQQSSGYAPLFDGDEQRGEFEFKWDIAANQVDGKLPSYVKLPTTLHFAMKVPGVMSDVQVLSRTAGNGVVKSIKASITFEDGTVQEFAGGKYDTQQDVYTFTVSEANKAKKVTRVDITPLTSTGTASDAEAPDNRMLTLREINFNYVKSAPKVQSVELGENKTSIYVDDLTPVKATVTTDGNAYPYFTVESSDPSVASISAVQDGDDVKYYVRGNKPGKATITVASKLDPSKTASYELEVKEGVNTSALQAALTKAAGYSKDAYTSESYAKLADAVAAANKLLAGEYTKTQVADATTAIEKAIEGLEMRKIDEKTLINTKADSGVTVADKSSQASESPVEGVLDYDESTIWHSSYNGPTLPQYVIFDLGKDYDLTDVTFLPRQDGGTNGDIFEAQVIVGDSVETLKGGNGVVMGTFEFDNNGVTLKNRDQWKQMSFGAAQTRYVMVKVLHAGGQSIDEYCSMSEIRFYGSEHKEQGEVKKDALQKLYDEYAGKKLEAADYTEASWKPFELAMADAKRLLADASATQDEVTQCETALEAAYKGLVKSEVPPVEKPGVKELNDLVKQAEGLDTSGKTPESARKLAAAISYAKDVAGNPDATPEEIKAAYDQLKLAIDGLTDQGAGGKPGEGDKPGAGDKPGTDKNPGEPGTDGTGGKPGANRDALPKTGDASGIAALLFTLGGAVSAAAGAIFKRRKR